VKETHIVFGGMRNTVVAYKAVAAVLGVIAIIFAAATGYFATNPTTITSTSVSTQVSTTTVTQTPTVFVAVLIGANEIPAVTTTASGSAVVTISPDGKTLHFVVSVNGIANVTLAHIHFGPQGQNDPVAVNLFTGPIKAGAFSGVLAQGNVNSTGFVGPLQGMSMSALITGCMSNMCYVNVHTSAHPGGEIRGYLVPSS
jgi:hypothetical protein